MKIKYLLLLVFIILIGFISFRTISVFIKGQSYHKHTDSTDLSNESFGEVRLHDNIHSLSFIEQYGVPLNRDDNDLYDYYHWKGGLETASIISGKEKGKIIRLIIEDIGAKKNNLKTAKGITIWSTKNEVISLYGTNYYERMEQGINIVGYIDKKLGITLEFWLSESGKVSEILLDNIKAKNE